MSLATSVPLFAKLAEALRERLAVIGDRDLRDRDPQMHLAALKDVSERIESLANEVPKDCDPQFLHYLQRHSYDKALAWLDTQQSVGN